MKQCAVCSRTYTDDTLEFCLDDGARLFLARETEATLVRGETSPPAWPPQPLPPPDWSQQPTPVQPVPAQKSRAWIPLLLALMAAGVLIGSALILLAYMNQTPTKPEEVAETRTPAPTPKPRPSGEPTPEPTPTSKPTPKATATPNIKETPEPKPTPIPEPTVKPTVKPSSGCVIGNDDPNQPNVNLRANCHVKSCDDDTSTIIGTVSNGTSVTVNRQVAPVRGRNFAWQQVTLSGGRIGWVAASKIRCQ